MESKVNYTIVGLFVIVLAAVIILMSLWLSFGLNNRGYHTYLVYMNESVAGLSKQSPVKYNGVDVGYVQNMQLNAKNPGQVVLTLKIAPSTPISQATEALLMEQGLTGIAFVGLQVGRGEPRPIEILPGQDYPVIKSAPSFLLRLDTTVQSVVNNITALTDSVQSLLDKQNLQSIKQTLEHFNQITQTLAANSENFNKSMQSMTVLLNNAAEASKQLPATVTEIKNGAASISTMSNSVKSTIKSTKNAINVFSDQVMPETYSTIQNINTLSNTLQSLVADLKQQPNILISGQKPPKPGPGEK